MMDTNRFDALARALNHQQTRRGALGVLAGFSGLGLGAAAAKKGKKRKPKQKPRFNQFGCVNVGGFCKNSGQCCSNICRGKKGKRTCRAHNTGGSVCEPVELGFCGAGDDVSAVICNNGIGRCVTTTGNAPYCAGSQPEESCSPDIVPCTKDKECQRFCGADAACIQCPACAEVFGVSTACAGPDDSCQF